MPSSRIQPDSDCGIQFNLSIDILDPNLLSFELYKRNSGEGDINLMTTGGRSLMTLGHA